MGLREQLCDAPGVELVGQAAADGSGADQPAACAGSLVTVCTDRGVDTSVGKIKTRSEMKKKPFVVIGLLSHGATA